MIRFKAHKRIFAIIFAMALTLQMAAPGLVWEKIYAEDDVTSVSEESIAEENNAEENIANQDEKGTEEILKQTDNENEIIDSEVYPAWEESMVVDGITIKAAAKENTFSEKAKLIITRPDEKTKEAILAALEEIRDVNREAVHSFFFIISVDDPETAEIRKEKQAKVKLTFTTDKYTNENLEIKTYCISGEANDETFKAEELKEEEVKAEATCYALEFTGEKISDEPEEEIVATDEESDIPDVKAEDSGERVEQTPEKPDENKDSEIKALDDGLKKENDDIKKSIKGLLGADEIPTGVFSGSDIEMILIIGMSLLGVALIVFIGIKRFLDEEV